MSEFLYNNFYFVQCLTFTVSVGAIVANCIHDITQSNKQKKVLNEAIAKLEFDRGKVDEKIKAMRSLYGTGKKLDTRRR